MSYVRFLLKKVTANKYNYVFLVIMVLLVGTVLFFNVSAKKDLGYLEQLTTALNEKRADLASKQTQLSEIKENDENYTITKQNIELLTQLIQEDEANIQLYTQGDVVKAYDYHIARMQFDKEIVQKNPADYDNALKDAIDYKIALFHYLKDRKIEKDSEKPVQGIHFMMEYWLYVVPISVVFLLIFILVNLYTDKFKDGIDISLLYPDKRISLIVKDIGLGILLSSILFMLSVILAFISATFISGPGRLDYPFNIYAKDGTVNFIEIGNIILPSLLLQILSFAVSVVFLYVLSEFVKHKLTTLLVGIIVILGSVLLTNVVVPIQQIAHLNPFIYINSVGIVSGEFGHVINNYQVTMPFGIGVLCCSLVVLVFVGLIQTVYQHRQ